MCVLYIHTYRVFTRPKLQGIGIKELKTSLREISKFNRFSSAFISKFYILYICIWYIFKYLSL